VLQNIYDDTKHFDGGRCGRAGCRTDVGLGVCRAAVVARLSSDAVDLWSLSRVWIGDVADCVVAARETAQIDACGLVAGGPTFFNRKYCVLPCTLCRNSARRRARADIDNWHLAGGDCGVLQPRSSPVFVGATAALAVTDRTRFAVRKCRSTGASGRQKYVERLPHGRRARGGRKRCVDVVSDS